MFHVITLPDGCRLAINVYDIDTISEAIVPGTKMLETLRVTQVFLRCGRTWQFPDPRGAIMDGILAAAKGYPDPEDYAATE
jgi:hypothetical protein